MSETYQVNPLKVFRIGQENCPLLSRAIAPAVATNTELIAGVAAKRLRIMGWKIQTNAAKSFLTLPFPE